MLKRIIAFFVSVITVFSFAACTESDLTDNEAMFSISCETIVELGGYDENIVPSSGIILEAQSFRLKENESALDLLLRIARQKNIHTDVQGGNYLVAIGNIYAGDYSGGPSEYPGWMLVVNGAFLNVGAGDYKVQDGDILEWKYSCSYGDLGIYFAE